MTPRDRVALIIVSGLVSWGALSIIGAAVRNKQVPETSLEILGGIAGAFVTMLATYFATGKNGDGPK